MPDDDTPSDGSGARARPKQERGVETRNAILDAAAELFAERGYEETTTHQIARAAGVSVGALYRYFEDKQAVIEELYRREISGLRDRVLHEFRFEEVVGKDMRALVRKALALAFHLYRERPGLRRVLAAESRRIPGLARLRRSQEEALHSTVAGILRAVPGVRAADAEVSAYLISVFVDALAEDFILYRPDGFPLDDERVLEGAVDMMLRHLVDDR